MDNDTFKMFLPLLAGTFALVGGALTFINGRLKDAEGRSEKERVIYYTLMWISVGLTVFGVIAGAVLSSLAVTVVFYCLGFAFFVAMFLRTPGPMQRIEVVICSLSCSIVAIFIAVAVPMHFIDRIIGILERMVK